MSDAIPRPDRSERDWTEDFNLENGNYQNQCLYCKQLFYGYKRRVVCKVCDGKCADELKPQAPVLTPEELAEIKARAATFQANAGIADPFGDREYGYIAGASSERLKAREEMRIANLQHEDTFLKMMDARKQSREKDTRIDSLQEAVRLAQVQADRLIAERDSLQEEVTRLKAQFKPVQLCPKCQGTGVMSRPPGIPFDQNRWDSSAIFHVCDICHGAKTV